MASIILRVNKVIIFVSMMKKKIDEKMLNFYPPTPPAKSGANESLADALNAGGSNPAICAL